MIDKVKFDDMKLNRMGVIQFIPGLPKGFTAEHQQQLDLPACTAYPKYNTIIKSFAKEI